MTNLQENEHENTLTSARRVPELYRQMAARLTLEWDDMSDSERRYTIHRWLVESRVWIANEQNSTDPWPLAQFRIVAESVVTALRPHHQARRLSIESLNEALEVVRRTERALSMSIKAAQDAGLVSSRDKPLLKQGPRRAYYRNGNLVEVPESQLPPRDIPTLNAFYPGSYGQGGGGAGGDGRRFASVSDALWEKALELASSKPGLLRRIKVLRVLEDLKATPDMADWVGSFEDMARQGYTSEQIAEVVGRSEDWVRRYASDHKIVIPGDKARARTRRYIDPMRVVRETAISLDGAVTALELIDVSALPVADQELSDLAMSMQRSLTAIRKVINKMKEQVNGTNHPSVEG